MQDRSRPVLKVDIGATSVSVVTADPDPDAPDRSTTVVLAHGAGRNMDDPFLSAVHQGLAAKGYRTVKFNFPYSEQQRRAPDPTAVLERCYRTVLEVQRKESPDHRLVIGGKSMGGRMASHLAAAGEAVDGLIFLGYPLHPAGKPEQLRDAHLPRITAPMLFFAGTRDALCRMDLLQSTLARLHAPLTVHVIEGGDHSFDVLKSLNRSREEVWGEIISVSDSWLAALSH